MAIEVSVRKEISTYKEKLIFGFSLRQFMCVLVALFFSVGLGVLNYFIFHLKSDDIGLVILLGSVPILAFGWYEKESLPLEKYLRVMRRYRALRPHYVYMTNDMKGEKVEREDKKEDKQRKEVGN